MAKVVRTVRFDQNELKKIEQFLKKNPFLDFSTLARLSISHFIENPSAQIKPLGGKPKSNRMEAGV